MSGVQRWMILASVYLLFLAIGVAALLAAIGFFPDASPRFREFAVAILVVDVVAAALSVFRLQFAGGEARVFVNIVFDGATPADVHLERCDYVVYDGNQTEKKKGRAAMLMGPGGWQCQFSWIAEASDTAQLEMVDQSGKKWRVRSFSPTTVEQRAYRHAREA